jgi:hypothetical protein
MDPIKRDTRIVDGREIPVVDINASPMDSENINDDNLTSLDSIFSDESFNETGDSNFLNDETPISETDIKVTSMKQAIKIARLFSNVTVDDIIETAGRIAKFHVEYQLPQ